MARYTKHDSQSRSKQPTPVTTIPTKSQHVSRVKIEDGFALGLQFGFGLIFSFGIIMVIMIAIVGSCIIGVLSSE
jgi:hypothetical protein